MVGDVKMAAESKGTIFAKTVQKHAGRAKEKILQKVGKVDRTADEIFDDHVQNFTKQQNVATKLQKEVNNYIRCIKAMQTASKSLYECIGEVYEGEWSGHDLLYLQTQTIDMLWQDLAHKLTDQVLIPLNTYQAHFPEMRKKIEKRNRKLVDFDSQRHSYQGLQSTTKKRDEIKITKAKEQADEAKRTFGVINSELNDELPALFDSRILFYTTNLQTYFSAEQVFHSELSKVHCELETIIEKLAKESQRNTSTISRRISSSNGASPVSPLTPNSISSPLLSTPDAKEEIIAGCYDDFPPPFADSPELESTPFRNLADLEPPSPVIQMHEEYLAVSLEGRLKSLASVNAGYESEQAEHEHDHEMVEGRSLREEFETPKEYEPVEVGAQVTNGGASPTLPDNNSKRLDAVYDIPVGATTENLPQGVLYRVRAAYKYDPEDEDELQLEIGDNVRVIEFEDPEEQEEGWLLGIKESTGQKGLFPANFTRPI